MEIVLITGGLLAAAAAYAGPQLGLGTPEGLPRRRAFTRVRLAVACPLLLAIGVVALRTGLQR